MTQTSKESILLDDFFKEMLNSNPLGVFVFDSSFRLLFCNQVVADKFGFENNEELLINFHKIIPYLQVDGTGSIEKMYKYLNEALENGESKIQWTGINLRNEKVVANAVIKRVNFNSTFLLIVYVEDQEKIEKIKEAKELAEQSTKAKSEFLANMSHEVRTPMNGIIGLLNILVGTKLDSIQQNFINKALFSANELLRILNDILDLSKIEASKLEMENIVFNIHDICADVQSLYGANAREKSINFYLNEDETGLISVIGDSLRLKQVLSNLISNAIKFTSSGSITLNINKVQQDTENITYQFEIKDTGIGISEEHIKELFSPFMQADTSITRKFGGTGLGLHISKSIVEMMNGKIWIESKLAEGSSFFFTATFKIAKNSSQNKKLHEVNELYLQQNISNKHLLLVEDNNINQLVAKELLKKVGYTIDIADNGQIALDMLEKNSYDAVLMDIQMPVMDGFTATTKIRENPKYKDLPIIAMSAHASNTDREKSLSYGMNEHITKPISPTVLYDTLNLFLNKN